MSRRPAVTIIGGGPAASATAIQLGRAGISALIIEKGNDVGEKIGETLPPDVRPILDALGVTDRISGEGHLLCHGNRSIWGDGRVTEHSFIMSPYGSGWHLDRPLFERSLAEGAVHAGAERLKGITVSDWERNGSRWRLQLSTAERVTTNFVVDATGRAAWFARRQGARRKRDDSLVAVVAFLVANRRPDPDTYTFVEATETGWWYTAPIPHERLATAYITDRGLLDRSALTEAGWRRLSASAPQTAQRIEQFAYGLVAPPLAADASGSLLSPVVGEGWAAVGDAAAAFDPLSSYGIAGALAGGLNLGKAIAAHLAGDTDSVDRYGDTVVRGYGVYRAMRSNYYSAEKRWPNAAFWLRRNGVPTYE